MPMSPEEIVRAFCAKVIDRDASTLESLLAGETVTEEEGLPSWTNEV